MIIKTKDFQEAANKILLASGLDKNAANLELVTRNSTLYLNVTNREFYVSVKFPADVADGFRAVVDANSLLTLISGITAETFEILVEDNLVKINAGKSKYKLAMIFENDHLMALSPITITNQTLDMTISKDILSSIVNVNSKEIAKLKGNMVANDLQKLYYIDETGCFTFTTGSCLNSFTLEKPVKLLLNDRIVKLFKLFKDDVAFSMGQDPVGNGAIVTKIAMQTEDVYLGALVTCDDTLIAKVQAPCAATKRFISEPYDYSLVLSANEVSSAINRILGFTRNNKSDVKPDLSIFKVIATIEGNDLTFRDKYDNTESITIENGSNMISDVYTFKVNLVDIKLVVDSCHNEHVTFNCGNHRSVVITRGPISNLIPEMRD